MRRADIRRVSPQDRTHVSVLGLASHACSVAQSVARPLSRRPRRRRRRRARRAGGARAARPVPRARWCGYSPRPPYMALVCMRAPECALRPIYTAYMRCTDTRARAAHLPAKRL